jgi:hypothetical protein
MAQTTNSRDIPQAANSIGMTSSGLGPAGERRKSVRRVSIEQEKADFAAWLREYRRWTQTGCSGPRNGEIEWGGEDVTSH